MKIQVNSQTISITKKDFLSSGGEGSVYVKGRTAYKIYTDRSRMIPLGKINELSVLSDSRIIKPKDVIYSKGQPIGYTMRFIKDTYSLCQLFTKTFKDRHNLSADKCLDLIKMMQETIHHIHNNKILIVDVNEMNFLANKKFDNVYFIDVDSYQTESYPATALMDSIRDRHNSRFNTGTDWFSFAIISFQLLIGIHPYKGKHPTIRGLDNRMQENVSVFNKEVRVPKSCLSFSIIPDPYKSWYIDVFDNGLRESPPSKDVKAAAAADIKIIVGSDNFNIEEVFECKWNIHQMATNAQNECIIGNGACVDRKHYRSIQPPFSVSFYGSTPIASQINDGKLSLTNIKMSKKINCDIRADEIMATEGRLYSKAGENILEVQFYGSEVQPLVGQKLVGKVLPRASHVFHGVIIQNLLGTYYASIFPAKNQCIQKKLDFLNGYRIIEAKYSRDILMVIGTKNGKYDRFTYNMYSEEIRAAYDVHYTGLNFIVLDRGICIHINEQDQVEVFYKGEINKIKVIDDPAVHSGMRLFTDGVRVFLSNNNKLYIFKMKGK